MTDTHPLALAYLRAFAAAHGAAEVPMGVRSPALAMHRAQAAWVAAGCPIDWDGRPEICPHDRQPCDGDCPAGNPCHAPPDGVARG